MKRSRYKKYFFLGVLLFILLSLPVSLVEKYRGKIFSVVSTIFGTKISQKNQLSMEQKRLEAENQLLRIEIAKLHAVIQQNQLLANLQKSLLTETKDQRYSENCLLTGLFVQAIPAKVIFRDPAYWTSSLWINVGKQTNKNCQACIVEKNSPVVLGRALVGVVDYVGEKLSRVRLITDSGVCPAVRAVRGYPQNSILIEHIDAILRSLSYRKELPLNAEDNEDLFLRLQMFKKNLEANLEGWHLAKGILQGKAQPIWRFHGNLLKGIGFNYDFSDEEGPARELRSGRAFNASDIEEIPILKMNDLLVTTGMDGIFPAGLPVAEVTKIFPLKEGSYTYEIEAKPVIPNMNELNYLFVIPSIGEYPYENH